MKNVLVTFDDELIRKIDIWLAKENLKRAIEGTPQLTRSAYLNYELWNLIANKKEME